MTYTIKKLISDFEHLIETYETDLTETLGTLQITTERRRSLRRNLKYETTRMKVLILKYREQNNV